MSQDQRPAPIRAVTPAPAQQDGTQADAGATNTSAEDTASEGESGGEKPAKAGSALAMIAFLIGCAGGGAAMAAMPHIAPQFFATLTGQH